VIIRPPPGTYKADIVEHTSAATGSHPRIIDYKGASHVFGFSY